MHAFRRDEPPGVSSGACYGGVVSAQNEAHFAAREQRLGAWRRLSADWRLLECQWPGTLTAHDGRVGGPPLGLHVPHPQTH